MKRDWWDLKVGPTYSGLGLEKFVLIFDPTQHTTLARVQAKTHGKTPAGVVCFSLEPKGRFPNPWPLYLFATDCNEISYHFIELSRRPISWFWLMMWIWMDWEVQKIKYFTYINCYLIVNQIIFPTQVCCVEFVEFVLQKAANMYYYLFPIRLLSN